MESLQILKYSISKGRSLNFTEGMSWDEELQEFEYLARTAPSEDPDTFGKNMNVVHHYDEDELEALVKEAAAAIQELENAEFEESDGLEHMWILVVCTKTVALQIYALLMVAWSRLKCP